MEKFWVVFVKILGSPMSISGKTYGNLSKLFSGKQLDNSGKTIGYFGDLL